jgi:methyl-accepting chemotaxis protein
VESLQERVSEQASVIEENSASITEFTENIREVHENTERAMRLTGELETSSSHGSAAVNDTIEAIADIASFSKEVKEAGEIISSIASQTDLLAMNASIEAAHAGNFGRGFAVVADEIRKLAEMAAKSAGEILSTIHSMDEKIKRTVDLAGVSGGTLETISDGTKRSAEVVTQITHAMAEQTAGANEMRNSYMQLLSATEESRNFIKTQREISDTIKQDMEAYKTHTGSMARSLQLLLSSDDNVKAVVARVLELAEKNNRYVGELYDRIMKFTLNEGGAPEERDDV